jgi:ATP-binding cassette subfamily F protein 3
MIRFTGVTKSFGSQRLFDDLTFSVNRRERVGLVGRNGHGKTTVFRMILGEVTPESGEIQIPKRYRIGHLDQHIRFTRPTVLEEASLGLLPDRAEETWRAEQILFGLGFSNDDMSRSPSVVSGGFQVRLNLAKAILSEPDLLLLDEPTNYLDVLSIRWLEHFLNDWRSELMVITHDRSFMDQVVTHTVAIHRRRTKKIAGDTGKLYAQILEEEEIYEKTRLNEERKRKEVERFIERFRAKNTLATRVQSRIKMLEKHERLEKLERIQTLEFSFRSAPFPAKVMMRADDVSFAYDNGPSLFSGLSLEIHHGDRVAVIGANGKGKSTLLRVLAGEFEPRAGAITRHPRLEVGYFAQTNVHTLHAGRTVLEEIQSADRTCLPQIARDIAGAMMFEEESALKKIAILSGGEKSRVMMAKLIVTPVNLLLLDEPTNHLDMDSTDSLLAAIDAFDGAAVIVTHDEMFLRSLATRFVVFDRGVARVFEGSYQDFLDSVGWEMDEILARGRVKPSSEPTKSSPAPKRPASRGDRKEQRQSRAKRVQERSRVIGPLEKRVAELETSITVLEAEADATDRALAGASEAGDAETIAERSKRSRELKPRIDAAYRALDEAMRSLEREAERFEEK